MQRRKRTVHRRSPDPYISSRKPLYADSKERFISGWDRELSNDQGISRVIARAIGVSPNSFKQSPNGLPTGLHGHIAGKRLVPKGGKGTGRRS